MRQKILASLFLSFAKVGCLTFGGGYAMLPMLQREIVENRGWATEEDLSDYYAIGQCTPGIIAVNTATFVGQKQAGFWGALCASVGVVFPSLIIITVFAAVLSGFADIPAVKNAFAGVRVCVCVLILNAVVKLWKKTVVDRVTLVIFLLVFSLAVFTDLSPVLFVLLAAVGGLAVKGLEARKK